jgi:hypothetical protein
VAYSLDRKHWKFLDLSTAPLGDMEPTFDWTLWNRENKLAILYQPVGHVWNGTATITHDAAPIDVLIWDARAQFHDAAATGIRSSARGVLAKPLAPTSRGELRDSPNDQQ